MSHTKGVIAAALLFVDQGRWRQAMQLKEATKGPFAARSEYLTWAHTQLGSHQCSVRIWDW